MVISRCDVRPSSTSNCSEEASACNHLWQRRVWPRSEDIPKEDKGEPRARGNGNEDLEDRTLRVAVSDGRRDGWEPFLRVTIIFILNNLGIVEPATHHQSPQERRVGHGCMSPGNPFAIKLGMLARTSWARQSCLRKRRHPRP
jgi:hypothetical protein